MSDPELTYDRLEELFKRVNGEVIPRRFLLTLNTLDALVDEGLVTKNEDGDWILK